MTFLRVLIQKPEGTPLAGLGVKLERAEPGPAEAALVGEGTTDQDGVVRFSCQPGTLKVQMGPLPEGMTPPPYGTTVRVDDFADGMEQIIRLVKRS